MCVSQYIPSNPVATSRIFPMNGVAAGPGSFSIKYSKRRLRHLNATKYTNKTDNRIVVNGEKYVKSPRARNNNTLFMLNQSQRNRRQFEHLF